MLAKEGLLEGKTPGIDSSTLEADAALRSIVRRDTGESYEDFLTRLAKASGIETPTRDDLKRLDRDRKKKGPNVEWRHPGDPGAAIAKMKDGRTHLARKIENAVDLDTGAVIATTVQRADGGDTQSLPHTLDEAGERLDAVLCDPESVPHLASTPMCEVVADKGYHSNKTMTDMSGRGIRSYVSEPNRPRRNWRGQSRERDAVYANRRRIRGERSKALHRKRGEVVERTFAHLLDTGGMRRAWLHGHENILKRLLIHAGGFNLGLVMRRLIGRGTPRGLQGLSGAISRLIFRLWEHLSGPWSHPAEFRRQNRASGRSTRISVLGFTIVSQFAGTSAERTFTTGC